MDASFSPEQDEIRRTLRELLHSRCGPRELRTALDTPAGHDPGLWTALAEQLGLPGLALPEAYGGVGCSATELALACEETGRALAPSPLLATAVLAAPLIAALGTDAQRAELLPRLASGKLTAALAVPGTALAAALALTGDNGGDWAGGGRAGECRHGGPRTAGGCTGRSTRCWTGTAPDCCWSPPTPGVRTVPDAAVPGAGGRRRGRTRTADGAGRHPAPGAGPTPRRERRVAG